MMPPFYVWHGHHPLPLATLFGAQEGFRAPVGTGMPAWQNVIGQWQLASVRWIRKKKQNMDQGFSQSTGPTIAEAYLESTTLGPVRTPNGMASASGVGHHLGAHLHADVLEGRRA